MFGIVISPKGPGGFFKTVFGLLLLFGQCFFTVFGSLFQRDSVIIFIGLRSAIFPDVWRMSFPKCVNYCYFQGGSVFKRLEIQC